LDYSRFITPLAFILWVYEETTLKMLKANVFLVVTIGLLVILSNVPGGNAISRLRRLLDKIHEIISSSPGTVIKAMHT
jgi:uncharacterized membrane protein AbrB (regulator of aidB expression)